MKSFNKIYYIIYPYYSDDTSGWGKATPDSKDWSTGGATDIGDWGSGKDMNTGSDVWSKDSGAGAAEWSTQPTTSNWSDLTIN